MFRTKVFKSNEIATQLIKLKNKVIPGANKNKNLFALFGTITSFIISLKPSAKGCKNPQNPTTLGPFLL